MQTQSRIRLAQPSEEPELLALARMMHAEGGMRKLDIDRVREMFGRAFNRQGGMLAVIGAPGNIRAMMFLLLTQHWYTHDYHLEEVFNWVHPDHRKSDYSKLMIEYAKKASDEMSAHSVANGGDKIPLIMGVLTNKRMAPKVRLYRRFFGWPYGAFFMHNAPWASRDDVCEEDFWRVPSLVKTFLKRDQRVEAREKTRVRA